MSNLSQRKKRWFQRHVSDCYVLRSKNDSFVSRSAYKLLDLQRQIKLIKPNMTILELGAAPGGWSQVVLSALNGTGRLISVDLLPLKVAPSENFSFLKMDILESNFTSALASKSGLKSIDLLLSDVAPNITGIGIVDAANGIRLTEKIIQIAQEFLTRKGRMLMKIFHNELYSECSEALKKRFKETKTIKPEASRASSREVYKLCSLLTCRPDFNSNERIYGGLS